MSINLKVEQQLITKHDFLNYFRYPKPFWFLLTEEIEEFFNNDISSEAIEDIGADDYIKLLLEIVESPNNILKENSIKLNRVKDEKLIECYRSLFQVPNLSFYNFLSVREDRSEEVKNILLNENIPSALIYKPILISKNLQARPTLLFKRNNKIYLIEHFWSTTLKKENLAHFVFYNYFFKKYLNLKIDQYLITFLSADLSPNKQLKLRVTSSLPFTSKVRRPEGHDDEKMKNINTFFGLDMDYRKSIYELIMTQSVFNDINSEEWEVEDIELNNPEIAINALLKHKLNPDKTIDLRSLINEFQEKKLNIVSPSSLHYKKFFQNLLPSLTYSANVLPLVKTLQVINSFGSRERQTAFAEYTSNLTFLKDFPKDQDYIVFQIAIDRFQTLKKKKIKVYYDFETVCLPYPYIENTKPYTQIVLQMSLIKTVDDIEEPTNNIIIDPLELSVEDFKNIIDGIYVDAPDVAYIVYNKSFENTRLKEMAELINEDSYRQKVIEIIDRTVDLANWFAYGNNPHIIHRKLQGFHSIKKVNKLIPKEIEKATGTKQYSDLKKCQNGVMAQAMLLSRALVTDKVQDEHNWKRNKQFMYDYCENDVRSMIAVEKYIEELINNNKYPIYETKVFLDKKAEFKKMKSFIFK